MFNALREEGWTVLRNGWPDFLAIRGDQVKAVEVKDGRSSLSTVQRRIHRALRAHGIEVELVRTGLNVCPRGGTHVFPRTGASYDDGTCLKCGAAR